MYIFWLQILDDSLTEFLLTEDVRSTKLRKRSNREGNMAIRQSEDKHKPSSDPGRFPVVALPFTLHLGFMAATAFLVMHVQVRIPVLFFYHSSFTTVCLYSF